MDQDTKHRFDELLKEVREVHKILEKINDDFLSRSSQYDLIQLNKRLIGIIYVAEKK